MAGDLKLAQTIIRAEYTRLCNVTGVTGVPLDIYPCNVDEDRAVKTAFGTPVANADPAYSGTKRLMLLPLCEGNDWPSTLPAFPPTDWNKHGWPVWRIELWHEVVHQVSNDLFGAWAPNEPGRTRPNMSVSAPGHGDGWFRGVKHLASKVGTDAETLDALLDQ